MLRRLHWAGILFGAGTGLVVALSLFALLGVIATNVVAQVLIQFIAFLAAGYVAGRFSLINGTLAGGIASLVLLFVLAVLTIAAGAAANVFGLLFLGLLAIGGGSAGAEFAEKRRRT
ncbi:MAG: hypothetical protein QGD89_07505 [Actinomycetota bacterium]|nr:hypothetical protein [Actinomycetota bacterium]